MDSWEEKDERLQTWQCRWLEGHYQGNVGHWWNYLSKKTQQLTIECIYYYVITWNLLLIYANIFDLDHFSLIGLSNIDIFKKKNTCDFYLAI